MHLFDPSVLPARGRTAGLEPLPAGRQGVLSLETHGGRSPGGPILVTIPLSIYLSSLSISIYFYFIHT